MPLKYEEIYSVVRLYNKDKHIIFSTIVVDIIFKPGRGLHSMSALTFTEHFIHILVLFNRRVIITVMDSYNLKKMMTTITSK